MTLLPSQPLLTSATPKKPFIGVELDDSSLDDFSLGSLSCDSLEDIIEEDEDEDEEVVNVGSSSNGHSILHKIREEDEEEEEVQLQPEAERTGLQRWQDSVQFLADVQIRNGRVPHVPVQGKPVGRDGQKALNVAQYIPQLTAACMMKEQAKKGGFQSVSSSIAGF